ncbi:DMT family transporter [Nocardia sp. NPDC023852]|uniref:DMT family transporter n=1 Tax=Nocardia sp. NPDC023852 TaxID=3154697 RepID=UPI0033DE5A3E
MSEHAKSVVVPANPSAVVWNASRVAVLLVATVAAGTLSPLQSAVNGALGSTVGDGNAAAVVSFGTGLLIMTAVVSVHRRWRAQALRLPQLMRSGTLGWWNYLAGLCGAAVVLSEGVSVGSLGVAVFQISLICGLIISGVVCDRIGVTTAVPQLLSGVRILGAGLAVVATAVAISPNFHVPHAIFLVALPFGAGLLAGWQPAGNAAVAQHSGSLIVAIAFNFLVGFVVLSAGLLIRLGVGTAHFSLPAVWWMYTGGALGLLSIGLMALLVRGLGLLLLGLASIAGQLLGSLLFNGAVPGTYAPLHVVTVVGTVLALAAAGIAAIPARTNGHRAGAAR